MHDKIIQIISETFRVKKSELSIELKMEDVDAWDSLTHMELIANLEEEFGFEFTNDEIMEMTSVGAVISIVEKKVGDGN